MYERTLREYVCVGVWHSGVEVTCSPLPYTAWGHPQAVKLTLALAYVQVRHKPIAINTDNNIKIVTVNRYSTVEGHMWS